MLCINSVSQLFIVLFNGRLGEQLLKPFAPFFPLPVSRSSVPLSKPNLEARVRLPCCVGYLFIPSLPTVEVFFFFSKCYLCALIYQHTDSFSLWKLPPLSLSFCGSRCYFGPQFFVLESQVSTRKSKGFAFISQRDSSL